MGVDQEARDAIAKLLEAGGFCHLRAFEGELAGQQGIVWKCQVELRFGSMWQVWEATSPNMSLAVKRACRQAPYLPAPESKGRAEDVPPRKRKRRRVVKG